eukprot:5057327-Heterocapsa_arctica.AAC.1
MGWSPFLVRRRGYQRSVHPIAVSRRQLASPVGGQSGSLGCGLRCRCARNGPGQWFANARVAAGRI